MAAKSRGMTTRQFRNLSDIDQVEIIALESTLSKMSEWEAYQDEIEAEKNQVKQGRR